jgi:hypothetical protein
VGEFVKEVGPLVADFEVLLGELETSFSSVGTSFIFPAQASLQKFESFFGFDQVSRIFDNLSVAECGKILNTEINANFLNGNVFDGRNIYFAGEDCVPLTCLVLLDSQRLDFSFWNTMQDNGNVTDFRGIDSFIRKKFESTMRSILGVCYAFDFAFESGKTFLLVGLVFDSAKEMTERFVESITYIL